jgi:hypothetical protein
MSTSKPIAYGQVDNLVRALMFDNPAMGHHVRYGAVISERSRPVVRPEFVPPLASIELEVAMAFSDSDWTHMSDGHGAVESWSPEYSAQRWQRA